MVLCKETRTIPSLLVQFWSSWLTDELICSSPVAAWPGLASAKSGRRSDSFHLEEEEEVVRRELTYSQPPRSRGAQDTGQNITSKSYKSFSPSEPELSFHAPHFVPTAPSVTSRREPIEHFSENSIGPNKNVTAADQVATTLSLIEP